ncbi:MAG: NADH-quinone oxidoreductase subunit B [Planctomycetaceae bacterium]|nr:NADH-quinone oxidoreductase subunit B [Planctomycetaceae bacterium]
MGSLKQDAHTGELGPVDGADRNTAGALRPLVGDRTSASPLSAADDSGNGFMATSLDFVVNWGRKNSLWPMPLGLSCCGIELMAMIGPKFDLARFGAEAARFTPRQCDLLVVAGTLTWKMARACRQIYDQMPDPKWVIAMGVCSSSGGMYDSYAVVQGVDSILPVDVYVPGCPPRPDAVIDGILKLQKKIEREHPHRRVLRVPDVVEVRGHEQWYRAPNAAVAAKPHTSSTHEKTTYFVGRDAAAPKEQKR